ncbi:MAG: Mut7-C RNAse domain-containing protein [Sphaerobacter sp.]|nr:Mut7-C RNAse domain-containing protein [Sphaerobacter sp.]
MDAVTVRFYAELNDFRPRGRRQAPLTVPLARRTSVKDLIESLGVPHTEVDLILANGVSVDFRYLVQPGDHISVYPVFESIDITPLVRVRPRPLREPRFVLDTHLGKLAAYLRLLGFDTLYRNDADDTTLARISAEQRRILLTRDRGLLKRAVVTHGYYIRADAPRAQALEVVRRFDLAPLIEPFGRCLRCNSRLRPVPTAAVLDRLPPRTQRDFHEFWVCEGCDRVFWQGSHYAHLRQLVAQIQALRGKE